MKWRQKANYEFLIKCTQFENDCSYFISSGYIEGTKSTYLDHILNPQNPLIL